jgi:hypothetical protein
MQRADRIGVALVFSGSGVLFAVPAAVGQVFNAGTDFSAVNNPNAPWAYGTRGSPTGTAFSLLSDATQLGPVAIWMDTATAILGTPAISKNQSSATFQSGSVTWLAGDFTMHPGRGDAGNRRYAVTRFTSPLTGLVLISGGFLPADSGSVDVHIIINGATVFTSIRGGGGSVGFEFLQALNAGDTVDFVVGDNGDFLFDTTVLSAFITPQDPQPCDDIDFNNNGVFPEDQDVVDFFEVLAGLTCPACNDIDFNNNGVFPEDQDIIDFFNVLAGGDCP